MSYEVQTTFSQLKHLHQADYRVLLCETEERARWQGLLEQWADEQECALKSWNLAESQALNLEQGVESCLQFLRSIPSLNEQTVLLMTDLGTLLENPLVRSALIEAAHNLKATDSILLLLSVDYPNCPELHQFTRRVPLPRASYDTLREILSTSLEQAALSRLPTEDEQERLVKAVLGLNAQDAERAFRRIWIEHEEVNNEVITMLTSEKQHLLQGSDLLEFHTLREGFNDVGGLEGLQDWIQGRVEAFGPKAKSMGIPQPKGVLLLGVQGCGKSLSARVIARQLSFPLVRLDIAQLLDAQRGQSERNLREALELVESISPAVLWIDELDKALAGFQTESNDAAMARIVGCFLTWMQEHRSQVFTVATANAVDHLPPEVLRRGRFDELFFIDLPNHYERVRIFEIHLAKCKHNLEAEAISKLSDLCEGFSGAEIEQIVSSAAIEAFARKQLLNEKLIKQAREQTVPLSKTMEEPIFALREWARERCRPATPDSRVMQMLEQEHRDGKLIEDVVKQTPLWEQLAEAGDMPNALIEYIRLNDHALISTIQQRFRPWFEVRGDKAVVTDTDHCVALWSHLSDELAEALVKCVNQKRIFGHTISFKEYQNSGVVLKLPVLEKLRAKPVPQAVWHPICLRMVPPMEGSGTLGKLHSLGFDELVKAAELS